MNNRMNDIAIYPKLKINISNYNQVSVETNLRKLHSDGKYYLTNFIRYDEVKDEHHNVVVQKTMAAIIHEVYLFLMFGRMNVNLVSGNGEPLFTPDTNQRSEEYRLLGTDKLYTQSTLDIFDAHDMD
jgi:hypothetical protein